MNPDFTNWKDARFGIFVHWSHISQQGIEISWPLTSKVPMFPLAQDVPVEQYQSSAATFNPKKWDAPALARMLRQAGAQYAVITAKHHDGYAMYDTKLSDFSIMNSPYKRDIVREFTDAVRAEGMGVGLYFSLLDWHHPDYPPFTDADKPYHYWGGAPQPDPEKWQRYLDFMFGQVKELLSNYGKIALIWFDGHWEHPPQQWKADELAAMIRSLQPGIAINDRLPLNGDFDTPEQFIPAKPPDRPWETCMCMNTSWGYNKDDKNYKSATQLIHTLCEVVGRGGHFLLNVSPMGDGSLPPEHVERLSVIGEWMSRNGESIKDVGVGLEPWQFYGPTTQKGNTLYLHLLMKPYESVTVRGVHVNNVDSVRVLGSGVNLNYSKRVAVSDQIMEAYGFKDPVGDLIIEAPQSVLDNYATVIVVNFKQ